LSDICFEIHGNPIDVPRRPRLPDRAFRASSAPPL